MAEKLKRWIVKQDFKIKSLQAQLAHANETIKHLSSTLKKERRRHKRELKKVEWV